MIVHEVFAHISEGEVKNIIVCDNYPTADYLAKCIYGSDAFAVDCLQYRCAIGDKYHDGTFWCVDSETGEEKQILYTPTEEQEVQELNDKVRQQTDEIVGLKDQIVVYDKVMTYAAVSFSDQQAINVPTLYPLWTDLEDGTTLTSHNEAINGTEITRVRGNDGKLYNVIKTHNKQSDWEPGQATASLFQVIDVEHAGTKEDPIPASTNMIYYKGKYYIEGEILYLCTRDSETALQHMPSQLVGHYFEVVTE